LVLTLSAETLQPCQPQFSAMPPLVALQYAFLQPVPAALNMYYSSIHSRLSTNNKYERQLHHIQRIGLHWKQTICKLGADEANKMNLLLKGGVVVLHHLLLCVPQVQVEHVLVFELSGTPKALCAKIYSRVLLDYY
jgi:hypothetical protein